MNRLIARIISITLGFFVFTSLTAIPYDVAFSQGGAVLKVNSSNGSIGQQVTVDITLSENSNVCVGNSFHIVYDNERLELVGSEFGDIIKTAMPSINENFKVDTVKLSFLTLNPIKDGGLLLRLIFNIKEAEGTADISIMDVDFRDFDEEPVLVSIENGRVEIVEALQEETTDKDTIGKTDDTTSSEEAENKETTSETAIGTAIGTASVTTSAENSGEEAGENGFNDLSGYDWARDEISFLAKRGIIKGMTSLTFGPQLNIKRADFIILMVRMLGLTGEAKSNFMDVLQEKYYYNEIGIAKELGLVSGIGDDKFDPEEYITRQDLFVIVYRIMKQREVIDENEDTMVLKQYTDSAIISDYAKVPVATFVSIELIKGADNKINPMDNATRAETAVFIYRLYRYMFGM